MKSHSALTTANANDGMPIKAKVILSGTLSRQFNRHLAQEISRLAIIKPGRHFLNPAICLCDGEASIRNIK